MLDNTPQTTGEDDLTPALSWQALTLLLLGAVLGGFFAVAVLPIWVPALQTSLTSGQPKAYWYLARASGLVAYVLLWAAMALGLMITNKLARAWPGGPTAFSLHQYTSLLALAFGIFHALVLLGDQYIGYTLPELLVPFAGSGYRPLAVGLGQIGIYWLAVVGLSFYIRRHIGSRAWRLIHFLSFAVYAMALAHGLLSGTDSTAPWAASLYWSTAGSLVCLLAYRVAVRRPVRVTNTHPLNKK